MNTQINLTELEQKLLTELIGSLYAEEGFSDVDAKDLARGTKIDIKIVPVSYTHLRAHET
jgi:hypothetical protein